MNQSFSGLAAKTGQEQTRQRALAVALHCDQESRETVLGYLDELVQLADTAGADVLDRIIQSRKSPDSTTWIGKGKAEHLALLVEELDCSLIFVDDDLSPRQAINLQKICGVPVVDRSALILDIFASRAQSREARTQVELAQLNYLLPRLMGAWTHLERQRGGIGMRGPGETQLETDRRLVRTRIRQLGKELEVIRRQRSTRKSGRDQLFRVSLVGYTNAGKSTLLNRLTGASVLEEDRLFATLDTTIRRLELADGAHCLLSDTVGFLRKLPHHLVASFRSTLEEAADADLLLHVVDLAHPAWEDHIKTVNGVLKDLGAAQTPQLLLFNKVDCVEDPEELRRASVRFQPSLMISATRELRLQDLIDEVTRREADLWVGLEIQAPLNGYTHIQHARSEGRVLDESADESGFRLRVRVPRARHEQLIQYYGARNCTVMTF